MIDQHKPPRLEIVDSVSLQDLARLFLNTTGAVVGSVYHYEASTGRRNVDVDQFVASGHPKSPRRETKFNPTFKPYRRVPWRTSCTQIPLDVLLQCHHGVSDLAFNHFLFGSARSNG